MGAYLFKASLSPEGVAGVRSEGGAARAKVVKGAIEALGGTVECFYFAFGDHDVIVVAQLPDNESAAAFAMEISSSGRVGVSTTVLLSPDEVDRSVSKKSGWRPPGA